MPEQYSLEDLLYLMSRLRDPDGGCPWDLKQDFLSITGSTVEEAYELVDAIRHNDRDHIEEELGDVLFQTIFYSQLARENDWFDFHQVVDGLTRKLIRRHPHVFPDGDLQARFDGDIDVEQVRRQWDDIKLAERAEKSQHGLLDDIPDALPALIRAQKMQKRLSSVGFDWDSPLAAISKLKEELAELEEAITNQDAANIEEEMGDLLFCCVNISRHLKVDAEKALGMTNHKCEQRFQFVENNLQSQGKTPEDATLMEMDDLWEQSKLQGKLGPQ
ncbi:Nucleoside triphosphate pyrophosphohydrolase [BD1-7 clade bacterium]|uniref:Nucleoside triphosphate pyrophosphohydrolase n=1 Tax=BD1-7 clade bacterium TaxID=2029982 RepID=A0A5S9QEP1_9GAMM|nr:Nucleoside triphosphate pyrophosphohydrolase [BD1-7 clade bacterium]CAA0115899.1 Nucleoside triphosphate pyrophosphohydrolase [BD1-7 clade bacterium]